MRRHNVLSAYNCTLFMLLLAPTRHQWQRHHRHRDHREELPFAALPSQKAKAPPAILAAALAMSADPPASLARTRRLRPSSLELSAGCQCSGVNKPPIRFGLCRMIKASGPLEESFTRCNTLSNMAWRRKSTSSFWWVRQANLKGVLFYGSAAAM